MTDTIYVLDFGSQYSHLITRRIRELGVHAELVSPNVRTKNLAGVKGIILSGGPQNLSKSDALRVDHSVFKLGVPVLGICYGMQLMAYELGGKVKPGKVREYGPARISLKQATQLFSGTPKNQPVWMSHGDYVARLPKGFRLIASSEDCPIAAMGDAKKKLYGLQFHPEVSHTRYGKKILANFVASTRARRQWTMKNFAAGQIAAIKEKVGNGKVVCALSGGVDSAVAAVLVSKAIGKRLTCIYVDTGLMRLGETQQIVKAFKSYFNLNLRVVKAEAQFLRALKGVIDPEQKRKIIGKKFIDIFQKEAKGLGVVRWLVQGTLYTDAITSGVSIGKTAAVIKSHHNVGGLPKSLKLGLIEPLRDLYKDEVRKLGLLLGLPKEIVFRQPFPGPGLAVRIIGEITKERLELLRKADAIVRREIERAGLATKIQQYFAVLPAIRSVGVQGDARTYGHPIIIRAVTTNDFMTADVPAIPYPVLKRISSRITNEVEGVNRIVYDLTSKPPGTVEWE